jgi:hypothetical protein
LASGGRKFTSCSAEMRTISATSDSRRYLWRSNYQAIDTIGFVLRVEADFLQKLEV